MARIGIITQVYKPEIGAAQNRLYEMAAGLKNYGWEVSIITSMPNYPHGRIFDGYRRRFFMKEVLDDMEVRRYWLYPSNSGNPLPRLLNWISFSVTVLMSGLYILRKKFDYLIVQSPPLLLGISGLILSGFSRSRMVLNISDLWPLTAKELGAISDGFLYRRFEQIEQMLYRRSFIRLGQSREIIEHIESFNAKRTFLFRNGVDSSRYREFVNRINKRDTPSIVYAGLLGVAQGIVDICSAIDFSKMGVEFHIYGAGPEQKKLESFLATHPDRWIFYHGQISRDEIPAVIPQYSASLIPLVKHLYGAVPSKIYESMAAGLPIFYSGEGEARKIIDEYDLGWTSSARDFETLKRNMERVRTHDKELALKRQNCLDAAKKVFSRAAQVENLNHYLNSFLRCAENIKQVRILLDSTRRPIFRLNGLRPGLPGQLDQGPIPVFSEHLSMNGLCACRVPSDCSRKHRPYPS
ncbi:MAG: glycosyltransferase family 4 protein [Bacteroidales bacterium]|nr:glycosyltransferase family 4 protein [Bacteroidales bacterium]